MDKAITRRSFLKGIGGGVVGAALYGSMWRGVYAAGNSLAASTSCPAITGVLPKRQLRGVWIATVTNIDWPSRSGLSVTQQQAEFVHLVDECADMNLNAVMVQVRPATDAFYPTQLAPWSQYLTGVQGQDPGYDPLQFTLDAAHARNLEYHAWFNPYRVSLQSDLSKLAPSSPARQHPDWVRKYGTQLYFDPGLPEVRQLIEDSILEVVERYDIDAVHFDDYFYPYPIAGQEFDDEATYQKYGDGFTDKGDWRRHNVNLLVEGLSTRIKQAKPWVKFGISPFGIWRNRSTDPLGSDTSGFQSYDGIYADTRLWVKSNWLDYILPQVYWNIGFPPAAYDALVPWWSDVVSGTNTALYIGQAAYKIGTSTQSPAWSDPEEMPKHLWFNQRYPEVKGDVYFSMRSLLDNPLGFKDRLEQDLYRNPALIPVMLWLGGTAPHHVALTSARRTPQGVVVQWQAIPSQNNSVYYVIYRMDGRASPYDNCVFEDPRNIVATVRRTDTEIMQTYLDTEAQPGQSYTYYVTAVDRLHHESEPSNGRSV